MISRTLDEKKFSPVRLISLVTAATVGIYFINEFMSKDKLDQIAVIVLNDRAECRIRIVEFK